MKHYMDIEHFCNAQLKYIMSVNVSYGEKKRKQTYMWIE